MKKPMKKLTLTKRNIKRFKELPASLVRLYSKGIKYADLPRFGVNLKEFNNVIIFD